MKIDWAGAVKLGIWVTIVGEVLLALGILTWVGVTGATSTALSYTGPAFIGGAVFLFATGFIADFLDEWKL